MKHALFTLSALALLASPALAVENAATTQTHTPQKNTIFYRDMSEQEFFAILDKDADGKITFPEFQAATKKLDQTAEADDLQNRLSRIQPAAGPAAQGDDPFTMWAADPDARRDTVQSSR